MTSGSTAPAPVAPADQPSQLASFRVRCEEVAGMDLATTTALHAYSVECFRDFWGTFLDWSGLVWEGRAQPVCTSEDVRRARFFPGVRLNYAENLLRPLPDADDDAPALTSVHGDGSVERLTRGELRAAVRRTAGALRGLGVGAGDRVVAIAPNTAATAVAALAVAALGATLSTATPDMGPSALLGRFGPIQPVAVLLDRTGMGRAGASADEVVDAVLAGLPTARHVLLLDDGLLPVATGPRVSRLADLVAEVPDTPSAETWERFPFDHPLWVMFSSGTTGPPKAMVHGAGGSLLEHVKEHRLHGDLRAGDTLYFHTTTAWMMWNWQLSALAVGAHVVLNDGPVSGPETLWELVARHHVTVFGTSPAYLQLCQDEGYLPGAALDLHRLHAVLSTGAVLHPWQFAWMADAVGDLPVQSISGGTDIVGCFVLGHPHEPVQAGRCQSLGLGLDVAALDDDGRPVLGQVGELVCRRPFPSRPVGFVGDPDGHRFTEAYFSQHPGVWTHGDLIEIGPDGSARMHGRSDELLNVNGIRIGPAEIYSIVRGISEVVNAMAVEQPDPGNPGASRLVLLVVLRRGVDLDETLAREIRSTLRREGSPAHVPSLLLRVDELPMTHSGKLSESAARNALRGNPIRNVGALRNPGSLTALTAAARRQTSPVEEHVPGPVEQEMAIRVAQVLRDALGMPVDSTANFFDAGGTSRQSMTLLRRLRIELGRPVSMEAFLADPTIDGLIATVNGSAGDPASVTVLRPGDASQPALYLIHGSYGDVDSYRYLLQHIETSRPVHGLNRRISGPDGRVLSLVEIAAADVDRVVAAQPDGPLHVAGYSFGGLVAYEMARRFVEMGRQVAFLGLLDVVPPQASLNAAERLAKKAAGALALLFPGMSGKTFGEALKGTFRDYTMPAEERALEDATGSYETHGWGPYAGRVTYFRVTRRIPVFTHLMYTWRRVAPDVHVVHVPGSHHDMLSKGNAPALGKALSDSLADLPQAVRSD